jgi:hypothetical protein
VFVDWEGTPIELRPFDLRAITWAERFFAKDEARGFDRMNKILSNFNDQTTLQNTIVDVVYHLGERDFKRVGVESVVELKTALFKGPDYSQLDRAFDTVDSYRILLHECHDYDRSEKIEAAMKQALEFRNQPSINRLEKVDEFKDAVEEVIKNSFTESKPEPEQTGGAIFQMLKAREKSMTKPRQHWEQIYTEFFLAGGMTVQDFISLTIKQINAILPEINFSKSKEVETQCDIHGLKLKHRVRRKESDEDFSDANIPGFEKMHEKLMQGDGIN